MCLCECRLPILKRPSSRGASPCHVHTSSRSAWCAGGFNSSSASRSSAAASFQCHSRCELHRMPRSQHVPKVSGPEHTKLSHPNFECYRLRLTREQIVPQMSPLGNGPSWVRPSTRQTLAMKHPSLSIIAA